MHQADMEEATSIARTRKNHARYALLRQAAEALGSIESAEAAARLLFDLAATPLRLDLILHFRNTADSDALDLVSVAGLPPIQADGLHRLRVGEPPCGLVAQTRQPLILEHAGTSEHLAAAAARRLGLRAYAGYPLLRRGRLTGTLAFGSRRRGAFGAEEIELLATLSHYVALAEDRIELASMAAGRAAALERALADKERLLQQTEILLKEVNHRAKNSLQMVVSLLELQRNRVVGEAARPLLEAGTRVMALAEVHARLYQGGDVRHVEMDLYLRDLCDQLQRSAGDGARVVSQVAPIRLETDRAIPVALIATELVMNAFRHGFPDGSGTATVTLSAQDDGVVLTVTDDGRGLPSEFDPRRSEGLGMRIVNSLTRQLGGQLQVASPDRGSCFRVLFPLTP